jgi:hypothetical protein
MFRTRRRPWKLLVPTAAAAMLFTLVPMAGVAEAATAPPPQDTSTFCQNVPADNPFTDVDASNTHFENILCLAFAGITTGKTPTTYDPSTGVTRGQMASFVARSIDKANELETAGTTLTDLPAYDGTNNFSDVGDANVHKENINRLFKADIVNGLSDEQCLTLTPPAVPPCYGPDAPVTRGQMASFINRSEEFLTGTKFATTDDFFTDDDGTTHEDNINGIASVGIAQGITAGTYAPEQTVSRQQMASFLIRWLAVEEAAGDIAPLTGPGPDLVSASATDADSNGTLSNGDSIVLTFTDPVAVASSITLTDADDTVATLTDDTPVPSGATPATFTLSNSDMTLTVTLTGPLVATGGDGVLDGTITITAASGIADSTSGVEWDPAGEEAGDVEIAFPASQGQTGTVTFVDAGNNTYSFVPDGGDAEVSVTYDSGDSFEKDGASATLGAFEGDLSVGDTIHFVDDTSATDADTHELTNVDPADVLSGTVGNVDTAANTFVFIEPVTGVAISDVKNYDAALYSIDGGSAVQTEFEDAINEGDTLTITDPPAGSSTYALTNETVTGSISFVDTATDLVAIGALGDDPTGPQDDDYNYALATSEYTVDGTDATIAEFEAVINEGDTLAYTRDAGTQTFALTNVAPPVQAGTVTETHDAATNTITYVDGAVLDDIDYSGVSVYEVDGLTATETEFEDALTVGDEVSFTPDDNATAADEGIIELTNSDPDLSVTGAMDPASIDTVGKTYDVVNADGGIIYDNLPYVTPPPDFGANPPAYFVNGAEVTVVEWEQYLDKIAAATDPQADINTFAGVTRIEHHLTTDQTLP